MRILFAPHEICGQMQLFTETMRGMGHDALAVSFEAPDKRNYRNDISLDLNGKTSRVRRLFATARLFPRLARNYDVFHFFFGRSLLPRLIDLPLLKRMGKRIFAHFHGSDLRSRAYLNAVVEKRLLGLEEVPNKPRSNERQQRCLATWRRYADGIFVSIPELLPIAPEAELLQQPIQLPDWPFLPETTTAQPREVIIAHAPSSRDYKGTDHVIAAVERLKQEGLPVALLLVEGIPFTQVRSYYERAHIAVDQLLQGSYGHVSIEFMALGKPVVAFLDPWYAANRPSLPIVPATPANLADVLRPLVHDQERRIALAHAGREYVAQYHDVTPLARRLLERYAEPPAVAQPA